VLFAATKNQSRINLAPPTAALFVFSVAALPVCRGLLRFRCCPATQLSQPHSLALQSHRQAAHRLTAGRSAGPPDVVTPVLPDNRLRRLAGSVRRRQRILASGHNRLGTATYLAAQLVAGCIWPTARRSCAICSTNGQVDTAFVAAQSVRQQQRAHAASGGQRASGCWLSDLQPK